MAILFERFIALTAALATASAAVAGCGDDADSSATGARAGRGGKQGQGGSAHQGGSGALGGMSGKATGGQGASGGTSSQGAGGTLGARGGGAGAGQSAGTGGSAMGGSGTGGSETGGSETGGSETGGSGTGGSMNAGAGGTDLEAGEGGMAGVAGEAGAGGEGAPGGAGAGGAPDESCFGDEGVSDCLSFPAGELPTDECPSGPNPALLSCWYSQDSLRPGVLEGLGECLVQVTDACTFRAAEATNDCENEMLARACPTQAAIDLCDTGMDAGGETWPAPALGCTDGSLTKQSCTRALSTLQSSYISIMVACALSTTFSGTCAERLHQCIFPHGAWPP